MMMVCMQQDRATASWPRKCTTAFFFALPGQIHRLRIRLRRSALPKTRRTCRHRMIFTSVQGVHLLANYKETLPKEERKPLVINDMQPLSFLQLFQTRTLALVRV